MRNLRRRSTALWVAALACLVFGFVPLLAIGVTAGMEFAWLLATDPQSLGWPSAGLAQLAASAFEQVLNDWAFLYMSNGTYDARLFFTQAVCAALGFAYLWWMRSSERRG